MLSVELHSGNGSEVKSHQIIGKAPSAMKTLFEKLLGLMLLIAIIGGGSMAYEFIKEKSKSPEQRAQERAAREAAAAERDRMDREMYEKHGFYIDCDVKLRGLKGIKTDCETIRESKW